MPLKKTLAGIVAAVGLASTLVLGGGLPANAAAVAAESSSDPAGAGAKVGEAGAYRAEYKPCNYVWGSRCVSWVTTDYSCRNIFQITSDPLKHRACSIYVNKGIVTVWP